MKNTFIYRGDNPKRAGVVQLIASCVGQWVGSGQDFEVTISEPKRTLDANACMWATLGDIARQVDWPHTDAGGKVVIGKMPADSWKAIFTAGLEQETRMAQGLGGGMVMLGARTSQYSRRKMGDLITMIRAFGDDKGVAWSEKADREWEMWGAS